MIFHNIIQPQEVITFFYFFYFFVQKCFTIVIMVLACCCEYGWKINKDGKCQDTDILGGKNCELGKHPTIVFLHYPNDFFSFS